MKKIRITMLLNEEQFKQMAPLRLKGKSLEVILADCNNEMNENITKGEILPGSCVEIVEEEKK